MSHAELEVLRAWANEILALEKARVMTVEEMNGTISLLHKGGTTDDKPQDWRPVVLLNCTNQLVMHILNARLRSIVEKAGILEPGQSGGRQGRSTDINLAKLEWVTQEAVAQGKRIYRVDVDFSNAFNAMSQAALWAVMRAYGIPDVDLLVSLYEHSTVRMAPNDPLRLKQLFRICTSGTSLNQAHDCARNSWRQHSSPNCTRSSDRPGSR